MIQGLIFKLLSLGSFCATHPNATTLGGRWDETKEHIIYCSLASKTIIEKLTSKCRPEFAYQVSQEKLTLCLLEKLCLAYICLALSLDCCTVY